jgi:hypothetical protein
MEIAGPLFGSGMLILPGPIHLFTNFAVPALLFAVFGMWASKAAAPQCPRGLQPSSTASSNTYRRGNRLARIHYVASRIENSCRSFGLARIHYAASRQLLP